MKNFVRDFKLSTLVDFLCYKTATKVDLFQTEQEKDGQIRAEVAQYRRKAFEHWLLEKRRF